MPERPEPNRPLPIARPAGRGRADDASIGSALAAVSAAARLAVARVYERYGVDNDWTRTVRSSWYPDRIDLATRTLKRFPRDPRLVLVAMTHLADEEFYASAAAQLEDCDVVLHEAPPLDDAQRAALRARARRAGFVDQGSALPTDDPRWRLADRTPEAMLESFGAALGVALDPVAVRRYCRTLTPAASGPAAPASTSARRRLRIPARTLRRLSRVVLEERNAIAIDAVAAAIDEGHRRIGVVYGAAHLFEIEDALRRRLGYRRAGVRWSTAIGNAAWLQFALGAA